MHFPYFCVVGHIGQILGVAETVSEAIEESGIDKSTLKFQGELHYHPNSVNKMTMRAYEAWAEGKKTLHWRDVTYVQEEEEDLEDEFCGNAE